MRLKAVILEGFRAYQARIRIELGDLVAFIGKNEVGRPELPGAMLVSCCGWLALAYTFGGSLAACVYRTPSERPE